MSRETFLNRVKDAVKSGFDIEKNDELTFPPDNNLNIESKSEIILKNALENSDDLFTQLEKRAGSAGWRVVRLQDLLSVGEYVSLLASERKSASIVCSLQDVIQNIGLNDADNLPSTEVFFIDKDISDAREKSIKADIGVTGVEYAIAETGTCVLTAGDKLGRLVALTPPVHVAVVKKGQVLPSLDDLFILKQKDFIRGVMPNYTNLISGPSRSADIEYKLVTGVHGPGEVHMLLVGED